MAKVPWHPSLFLHHALRLSQRRACTEKERETTLSKPYFLPPHTPYSPCALRWNDFMRTKMERPGWRWEFWCALKWNDGFETLGRRTWSAHLRGAAQTSALKCMEGMKVQKINIEKLMGIVTLALRIDNPSNGFENAFLENYDPPIQFHRQFCELAHSTMVLLCFFTHTKA